ALKQANPIEVIVASYGIELRRQGRALVGRCPLHADGGRPNFHIWPATNSWWCFRCAAGGDVIRFVELVEQVDFRGAVERLNGVSHVIRPRVAPRSIPTRDRKAPSYCERTDEELLVLEAATSLYHRRLKNDHDALEYVVGRGLD